jgi:hypothetical protein
MHMSRAARIAAAGAGVEIGTSAYCALLGSLIEVAGPRNLAVCTEKRGQRGSPTAPVFSMVGLEPAPLDWTVMG